MSRHKPTGKSFEGKYWTQVSERWAEQPLDRLWRCHSDQIHTELLRKWFPERPVEALLKTDLFDEAHSEGLIPWLRSRVHHVIGTDISDKAITLAQSHHADLKAVKADIRCLPFDSDVFDVVVSNSTIDHFKSFDEVILSIREFARVLRPHGELLLTVDNLANPLIMLRNRLPFETLNRLGLVPYYVGATCGPGRLKRVVAQEGLTVQAITAIEHCPRVVAVMLARLVDRLCGPRTRTAFLRGLMMFEHLQQLPTRFVSGQFVALRAVKPETSGGA